MNSLEQMDTLPRRTWTAQITVLTSMQRSVVVLKETSRGSSGNVLQGIGPSPGGALCRDSLGQEMRTHTDQLHTSH